MVCPLDGEIEKLRLNERALVRQLEEVRRDARAAHEEFRAQELQVQFVESSLRRLRECLDTASQTYRELAARAESATSEAERGFNVVHRRIEALLERRHALVPAPDLLRIYEAYAWINVSPRIVAVERGACSACGATVPPLLGERGLRSCPGYRRILYWRLVD